MNKPLCAVILLGMVCAPTLRSQSPEPPVRPAPPAARPAPAAPNEAEPSKLTRFDLNFPGGTPPELVAAIEKATRRPLNVVIPDEYATERIPALRMSQVTAPELFRAMEQASFKTIPYRTASYGQGQFSYQQINTSISFQTSGAMTDNSIWYFRGRQQPPDFSAWETKPVPVRASRFYSLTPYLEQGLKVEDITTAVQTGWKMLGETDAPSISFHKETKLLIAVGEPAKLDTIDAVLNALCAPTGLTPPRPVSFQDRLQSIIRQTNPPVPSNAPAAAPAP